jgi:myosin protein heavy chain
MHSYSVLRHNSAKGGECLASELASSTKRNQLEQLASRQRAKLIQLRDRTTKYDGEINKILSDLKSREWEVKQLESKQDKTIVEHVHFLEEAKRVTDRQLADAQKGCRRALPTFAPCALAHPRLAASAHLSTTPYMSLQQVYCNPH